MAYFEDDNNSFCAVPVFMYLALAELNARVSIRQEIFGKHTI